jgi:DNA modification methylase
MTTRPASIFKSPLTEQLKSKGRSRREDFGRLSIASAPVARRNDLLPHLSVSYIALSALRPSKRKLRLLDPAHVREVGNAIAALGFCVPLLIGSDNAVLDGEARLAAAKLLGLSTAPCIQVGHLKEQEQRLLRLAVNRLGEKGSWDLAELKIEFEELILNDAPIEISGFSIGEIDQVLIGDIADVTETGPLEPSPGAIPIAKLGDIFQLGPHRVTCGDARDPDVLRRLMAGDGPVRMVLSDPPYNVRIAGHVTGGSHREFGMASGEMSDAEFLRFNRDWLDAASLHLCDGGVVGAFIDWRGLPTVHAAAIQASLEALNLCVWGKTNAGMGSLYRSQHELFPLFKKGRAAHVNNVQLGKKGRWRSNLWTYPGASSLGSDARRGLQDHPTVKPTAMLADALLDLTNPGDLVLDPFLGSGSTLVAAHRVNRVCRGVELDPLYVDVIIRRWEAVSGGHAVLQQAEAPPDC